jgi:hypothetical protein
MTWQHLDSQMAFFAPRLVREVKLTQNAATKLATTIAADVRFLTVEQKAELRRDSLIPIEDRLAEIKAFQGWMEYAASVPKNPYVTRAQVLTQSYVCFVYMPESCFRALAKCSPSGSATKRCAQFLSNNPVRAYRNSIAHANWTYRRDFGAVIYWARKGNDPSDPLERFEVEQADLTFWQALSRCVA